MIGPTHPTWRPVRLEDEKSVEYLNRLFRQGWYLEYDDNDLPFMLLHVPLKTPKRVVFKTVDDMFEESKNPTIQVIILHKGKRPNRQMAVITKRDANGYFDLTDEIKWRAEWQKIISFGLDNSEARVAIYERKNTE